LSTRANNTNKGGIETFPSGNVTPINTWVTSFPRAGANTMTVSRLNAAMSAAGASVGDTVERDSDGGFWDTTAGCNVPCDYVGYAQPGNNMLSN